MRQVVCEATGKRSYRRHQDAAKVLGAALKHAKLSHAPIPQSMYRCEACKRWHLTSMTQREYEMRKTQGIAA